MSLGSIIVRLSLQTGTFETDAGRAAKVAERRAKEIDAAFRKAGNAIGAALGAGLLAAGVALKSTVDRMDEVSKAAQKVQMPTEAFSRLVYAGSLADVQMETLVSSMGKLTKAQAASLKDTSEQARVFDALGISAKNADGSLRPASDVLLEFADRFKALDGSPEAMAAGFALFGRSFQEMIPLIKDGSGAMRELFAESDKLGATLSTDTGKAAEEFNDNLTRMQTAVNGAWKEIAIGMLPQLTSLSEELVDASAKTNDLREAGDWLGGQVRAAATDLMFMVDTLRDLNSWANNTAEGFKNMGGAMARVLMGDFAGAKGFFGRAQKNADGAWTDFFKGRPDFSNVQGTPPSVAFAGIDPEPTGMFRTSQDAAAASRESDAMRRRLQATLGGAATSKKSGAKPNSREMQDFTKEDTDDLRRMVEETARAEEQFARLSATLSGPLASAEYEHQQNLREIAALGMEAGRTTDEVGRLKDAEVKRYEDERKAIEATLNPMQNLLDAYQAEIDMIGLSNTEKEMMNLLRQQGIDLSSAEAQGYLGAAAAMDAHQKAAESAFNDQMTAMDGLRGATQGLFSDLAHGVNAWDALSNAALRFTDVLIDLASRRLMEQILGPMGSTQTGSAGGGLFNFLGSMLGSFFGGGAGGWSGSLMGAGAGGSTLGSGLLAAYPGGWKPFAMGGYTGPGGMNEVAGVAHRGEVIWSKGDVARAGGPGVVDAMRRGAPAKANNRRQRIVIVDDKRDAEAMMRGAAGEQAVMVHVERNAGRIKELILG